MYIKEFFSKYNGKAIDRDKAYGAQCMDLYNQYQEEVMGVTPKGASYAKDVWNTYNTENFKKITNTADFVPELGDVAVWGADSSNGYAGHVSICTGVGDVNSFESFDQNWSAKYCKYETHNYFNGFLGVLRPLKGDINNNSYTTGLYKTLYVMKVRDGVWGRVKTKEELTEDGKAHSNAAGNYLAGTIFSALEIINHTDSSVWARGLSGYVCIKDSTQEYCVKV